MNILRNLYFRVLLIIVFCVTLVCAGFSTSRDSLEVKLAIKSKEIKQASDLEIALTIKSYLQQTVYLPDVDLWGLAPATDAFYIIQIQKKDGRKYADMRVLQHIDNIPNFRTDQLHFGEQKELAFPIYILYHYTKGEYRVRVLCKFSTFNKLRDRYSDWEYFTCNEDIPIN